MLQPTPSMFVFAAIAGIISAFLASKRGKNPYLWFTLGCLFGILGIFAILVALPPKRKPAAAKQSVWRIDGPSDKFWYYLDPSNQQHGPMSRDALTAAWKSGKLNPTTYIWHEDLPNWKPLQESLKAEIL